MLIFNKQNQKYCEKLLCAYYLFYLFFIPMNRACDMSSLWFCFIALTDSVLCWYKLFLLTTRNSHLLLSYHACLSHSCTRLLTAECTCMCVSCPDLMLQPCMQWKNADLPWKWKNNQHIDYGCHIYMEEEEEWLPYGRRRRMAAIWIKKKNGCHMEEEEEGLPYGRRRRKEASAWTTRGLPRPSFSSFTSSQQ